MHIASIGIDLEKTTFHLGCIGRTEQGSRSQGVFPHSCWPIQRIWRAEIRCTAHTTKRRSSASGSVDDKRIFEVPTRMYAGFPFFPANDK